MRVIPCYVFSLDNYFGFAKYLRSDACRVIHEASGTVHTAPSLRFKQAQAGTIPATETNNNTMQNYCKLIGAMAAASALVAGTASAEVEYELHTGYASQYVFRGQDTGDNLTEVGLDAAYDYNGVQLSAGVWAAVFNNSPANTGNQIDSEVDTYGEAAYDFGYFTGAIGYIYYWNLGRLGFDQQEVYLSASKEFYGFETSFTYFWDVAGNASDNNGYSELYFGKGFELSPCLTLNTGVTTGYLFERTTVSHIQAKVALDWAAFENATISPFISHSWGIADNDRLDYDNEFIAGSILAVSF